MNRFLRAVQNADQFGASFKPTIQYSTTEYKTIIGGLASLILYGLSLSYFIYQINQWQTGQLLPKITTTQIGIPNTDFNVSETLTSFYIRYDKLNPEIMDPFLDTNLILQPILITFQNGAPVDGPPTRLKATSKSAQFSNSQIDISNQTFKIREKFEVNDPTVDYYVAFQQCLPFFLDVGQSCADNETVEKYFQQINNAIVVNFYNTQYNPTTRVYETIKKTLSVAIEQESTYFSTNLVTLTTAYIDTGFLFEDLETNTFVGSIETMAQQLNVDYFTKSFKTNVYAIFGFQLNQVQSNQYIEYPKISEVLADIGSIVSLLLLVSWLVINLNEYKLQDECVKNVIEMYYPKYSQVKIIKNWFGKVTLVQNGVRIQNTQQFMEYYEQLRLIATKKLTIFNQIYEISRLQFIVQSMQERELIKQVHYVGIQLSEYEQHQSNLNVKFNEFQELGVSQDYGHNQAKILPQNSDDKDQIDSQLQEVEQTVHQNSTKQIIPGQHNNNVIEQDEQKEKETQLLMDEDFDLLLRKESKTDMIELSKPVEQISMQFYAANMVT